MSKVDKILDQIMSGRSDANIRFDDVCYLLLKLGFTQRQRGGSHIIFQRDREFVNLQDFRGKINAYQVRQVRNLLRKN